MKKMQKITRREMLQLTGTVGASAVLAACGLQAGTETATVNPTVPVVPTEGATAVPTEGAPAAATTLKVYNPTGSFKVTQTFAPRLDSLAGKTIAFVSNGSWESERTFPLIQQLLQEQYPDVTFLAADQFSYGTDAITRADSGLGRQLLDAGAQAAIVGNAG